MGVGSGEREREMVQFELGSSREAKLGFNLEK